MKQKTIRRIGLLAVIGGVALGHVGCMEGDELPETIGERDLLLTSGSNHAFPSRMIDLVMKERLIDYDYFAPGENHWQNDVLSRAPAFYFLSLVALLDPNAKSSQGTLVRKRVLAHVRNLLVGGNEPYAGGGILGWVDGQTALGLALSKSNPQVWSRLSNREREKVTLIMKALAVGGHWTLDHNLNPGGPFSSTGPERTLLRTDKGFRISFGPNHYMGQAAVMVAARIFFGSAQKVNDIFASFDKAKFVRSLNREKFSNIVRTWQVDAKTMNKAIRGNTHNVGVEGRDTLGNMAKYLTYFFRYRGFNPDTLIQNNWTESTPDGVLLTGRTPYLGRPGYMFEFRFGNARSSARYAYDGWRNFLPIRATLQAMGMWGETGFFETQNETMKWGSEDMIYKLTHGYKGSNAPRVATGPHWQFGSMGYRYLKSIWRHYVDPSTRPRRNANNRNERIQAESFDWSNQYGFVSETGASGRVATGLQNGDFGIYYDVRTGARKDQMIVRYAANRSVKVRIGWLRSDSQQKPRIDELKSVKDITLPATGSLSRYVTRTVSIPSVTGTESLVVRNLGQDNRLRLDWFAFGKKSS